ncbi:hypothetical protein [Halomontanus rarus]|uniref:hypothetical protein n=1 Tax=Halomontanus rarus TaxID=3034020 RepID=UPI0023E835D9|nr:hypothetical protein [Halovivax sp. TS33]
MLSHNAVPAEYVEHFFGACHGGDFVQFFDDCGARWKRGTPGWHVVEAERGEYNFSGWDELMAAAEEYGVEVMPVLNYTAPWASTAPDDADEDDRIYHPIRENAVEDWQAFVRRITEQYPDLTHVEIWNEPNLEYFLRVDEERRHAVYVDRILRPAAEILHERGIKVVAPAVTTEAWGWNVDENIERTNRWLSYADAWQHVDYLSVHYTKGDTEKLEMEGAENLLPYLEWVHDEYVSAGKLDGVWNTEEGFTALSAGNSGFVALEPWERKPYPQWVPRYTVPYLHWAIDHGWDDRDDYKLFWYRMGDTPTYYGTLEPCNLLEKRNGETVLSDRGWALRTVRDLLTDADRVGTFHGDVAVGLGLFSDGEGFRTLDPYEFTSYAFTLDEDLLITAWLDVPGIEFTKPERSQIQATVKGIDSMSVTDVSVIDYVAGDETTVNTGEAVDGQLRLELPRSDDPVLYVLLSRG